MKYRLCGGGRAGGSREFSAESTTIMQVRGSGLDKHNIGGGDGKQS